MLVTKDNFKGIISLAAIFNTGNDRVDIPAIESIEQFIAKYEPEYFNKIFGVSLYNYLDNYDGTDANILSIKSNLTEAAACYIYSAILTERKGNYNGESIVAAKSEGNPTQSMEVKLSEVHNRMVDCNRNAIDLFYNYQLTLWSEKECYILKPLIEYTLC